MKPSSQAATLSHNVELEDITYKEGYSLIYSPIIDKVSLEREAIPIKTINESDFDSYCLLEEIGVTNQWVPCKIHNKKAGAYVVELKNRKGYLINKQRENLLLSKVEMQKYEADVFEL